eukprot:GHVQ01005175.1.p1 GENE.GHVQ01005175.1~~GHVQ01005175.1.p1  ORF type:complete len:354 (+),score=50.54 GHVQ01005175.1:680-1741(+)
MMSRNMYTTPSVSNSCAKTPRSPFSSISTAVYYNKIPKFPHHTPSALHPLTLPIPSRSCTHWPAPLVPVSPDSIYPFDRPCDVTLCGAGTSDATIHSYPWPSTPVSLFLPISSAVPNSNYSCVPQPSVSVVSLPCGPVQPVSHKEEETSCGTAAGDTLTKKRSVFHVHRIHRVFCNLWVTLKLAYSVVSSSVTACVRPPKEDPHAVAPSTPLRPCWIDSASFFQSTRHSGEENNREEDISQSIGQKYRPSCGSSGGDKNCEGDAETAVMRAVAIKGFLECYNKMRRAGSTTVAAAQGRLFGPSYHHNVKVSSHHVAVSVRRIVLDGCSPDNSIPSVISTVRDMEAICRRTHTM